MFVMPLGLNEMIVGTEWLIEAHGCDEGKLRDEAVLRETFARLMDELGLKAVGEVWHKFPGEGGVTGMAALTESHLACHTYPEYGIATFNLYCCRTRPEWDWELNLKTLLGAESVSVTRIERGNASHISEISNLKFEISNLNVPTTGPSSDPQSKIQNPKSKMAGGEA